MKLLVCGGAGFIGSMFVRVRVGAGDEVVVLDKLTYAGRRENLDGLDVRFVHGAIEDPTAVADAIDGLRGGRQLRRRDPRRSLDRRARRVRAAPTPRHVDAARGGPRARAALRPGLDRRGLRLDRGGLVHRDLAAASVVALQRDQGRRRPARLKLPRHLRPADRHLPRLQQLRPAPVPGEADPADDPQRAARRCAAGLRRRPPGPQLALRRGLRARRSARVLQRGDAGRGLQRRRPRRVREHRGRQADRRADRAPTSRSSTTSPTAPATTAATRWPRDKIRALGWEPRMRSSSRDSSETVAWYRDNPAWWEPIRSGDYRAYYERQYGRSLG